MLIDSYIKRMRHELCKNCRRIIVIVLAALLLADGVLGLTGGLDEEILSLPAVKLVVGLIGLVLAGAYLEESRK